MSVSNFVFQGFRRLRSRGAASVACVAALVILSGCAKAPYTWAKDIPADRARPDAERKDIRPGDIVALMVVGQVAMSAEYRVGSDGAIAVPNIGTVVIGGTTAQTAQERVKQALSVLFRDPKVSLTVILRSIEVTVMGEVEQSGKLILKSGDGVAVALAMAGGLNAFGDDNEIFLIRSTEPLRIRFRMEDLLLGGDSANAFSLRDGDLLVVE